MAIRNTTQLAQPAGSTVSLPTAYPSVPRGLARAFPEFAAYHADVERIYKRTREAIRNTAEDLVLPINKAIADASYASTTGLTARIDAEESARIDGDAALATSISTVSSSVTTLDGTLTAAIAAEAATRATRDGYVEGSYTLTATAGNVTTGMRLISSSGTTPVSAVMFQADVFQIYNGTTGVPAFNLAAGNLTLNGSITLLNTQVTGLGALATQNDVAYGSITGTKPPANADVTLSAINGGLNLTGGGLVLASGGAAIRGGQTAYDTGNGFWLGDVSGTTKFSLGSSAGNKITWDGTTLLISGGSTTSVDWATQVTGRPTDLTDGRIPTAINASGLIVTGVKPGITVTPGGVAGLYLGSDFLGYYNGSSWRTYMDNSGNFYLGGAGGALTWNGSTLNITGNITLTNTIASTSVTGLGALATQNDVSYGSITGTKPPTNADVTLSAIQGGLSLAGGGLVLASAGASLRGGQTAYDTGNGFWLGDVSGTTKFSLGNSAGNKLTWDGSALAISGTLTSTSGTVGGFTLGADNLTAGSGSSLVTLSAAVSPFPYLLFGPLSGHCGLYSRDGVSLANSSGFSTVGISTQSSAGSIVVLNASNTQTITLTGSTGAITASSFSGSGASLTSLNASNISSGTLSNSRLSGVCLTSNNLSDVTASTARSNLGLGSIATQASSSVNISGGTVDGCTSDGFVYSGVTGSSRFSFGWDAANTRMGVWVDGTLKILIDQNV